MTYDQRSQKSEPYASGFRRIDDLRDGLKSACPLGAVSQHLVGAGLAAGVGFFLAVEPAAAQDFAGGTEIESFLESFIPWALRWMLVIGTMVAVAAHIFAGWTADPDKAFRRKEWRNRAFFGVALAIPALLLLNAIITTFGGQPIDFLPFV